MSQQQTRARQLLEHYCRQGSQPAFNEFYHGQAGRLWRFLRFRGVAEDAAYDLVAETFLKFIQVVCRDLRAPVALLYRIALNLKTDAWRRDQTASAYINGQSVTSHYEEPAEQIYLRQLIQRLPESEQNLLLMRYWIGLTHREIAAATGQPAGTVRRRTTELLEQLRQQWAREQAEPTDE